MSQLNDNLQFFVKIFIFGGARGVFKMPLRVKQNYSQQQQKL